MQHGRSLFAERFPFVRFATFDVAAETAERSFGSGSFDLVLASHVLHAVPRLAGALNEIKKLLKTNGLLILNEATSIEDFATLTYGLLEGWWQFQDGQRLRGSPLLDLTNWRIALCEAGFPDVRDYSLIAADASAGNSQALIVARSDGIATFTVTPSEAVAIAPPEDAPTPVAGKANSGSVAEHSQPVHQFIEKSISAAVMKCFALASDEINVKKGFSEVGADSIVSVELIEAVNAALGLALKTPVLFDYTSIRDLTRYVLQHHGSEIAGKMQSPVQNGASPLPSVGDRNADGRPDGAAKPRHRQHYGNGGSDFDNDEFALVKATLEALEQGLVTPEEAVKRVHFDL